MRVRMDKSYLMKRGDVWWYNRRVPERVRHLDPRGRIRKSLDTYALEEACLLRDKLAEADTQYWAALKLAEMSDGDGKAAAEARYRSAIARAEAAGFSYRPVLELVEEEPLANVLDRLQAVRDAAPQQAEPEPVVTQAILGGIKHPEIKISEAHEIYFKDIALNEQMYKSERQKASWRKVKQIAIRTFIDQFGDMPMDEITREHALAYKAWWAARVFPDNPEQEPVAGNTANRRIGGIRGLYRDYYRHIGEEDRPNPFRNINFNSKQKTETASFERSWVEGQILKPRMLEGLKAELQLATYMLIETGCRPSEIINLQPEDIILEADVPHIWIRARSHGTAKRELKTASSMRKIPLVGVSLEAARRAPLGFEHYRDRNELFSASLMRAFKVRELLPSKDHKVYSFRHSFEKRMQEANVAYGLRCLLMGHKTDRPAYGDFGSLSYRRDELMKIVHSYSDELFAAFDAEHAEWALAS